MIVALISPRSGKQDSRPWPIPIFRRSRAAGCSQVPPQRAWSVAGALPSPKAPMANTPAPSFYRFKLGAFELTAVSDGPLQIGPPQANLSTETSKEDMAKTLADNFLPTDNVAL